MSSATRPNASREVREKAEQSYVDLMKARYPTAEWQSRYSKAVYSWR